MSYAKTYRMQGIPAGYTKAESDLLLRSTLGDDSGPTIHSLGLDPSPSGDGQFQIATVSFRKEPPQFQDGENAWTLPVGLRDSGVGGTNHSITVDCHFLGFTPLNAFEDESAHKIDCIAITGLSSHPFGSWKQRSGEYMWLRDSLPLDMKDARILSYGYDTGLLDSKAFQGVDDIALGLCRTIKTLRKHDKWNTRRPLIFISHSLGGVILKRTITEMSRGDDIEKEIFRSIYGVCFFGVPNQGMKVDQWLRMIQGRPNEDFVRTLGFASTYLRRVHEDFQNAYKNLGNSEIVAVYETENTRLPKQDASGRWTQSGELAIIVPIASATDFLSSQPGYHVVPLKRNHSEIVKFSNRWDPDYKVIKEILIELGNSAISVVPRRFSISQGNYADRSSMDTLSSSIFDSSDHVERTQLHRAVASGDVETVKELSRITHSANYRDPKGRTPLHIAAQHGRDEIARVLIIKGARQNAKSRSRWTPLHVAAFHGHDCVIRVLVEHGSYMEAENDEEMTPLYTAATRGHAGIIKTLAEHGADTNTKRKGSWTPLHAAAWCGHLSVAKVLLEKGARINAISYNGQTPLFVAARHGREAMVKLLLLSGADWKRETSDGVGPLRIAEAHGHHAVVNILKRPAYHARLK